MAYHLLAVFLSCIKMEYFILEGIVETFFFEATVWQKKTKTLIFLLVFSA